MVEFTGERVIPGRVDENLFNEHLARYVFASRLARRKRVLDAGCGAGYGSAELAAVAESVLGVDSALEAVEHATENYGHHSNLRFETASCGALPCDGASIDLVTAFEVIEHLVDWRGFLAEVARVLAPGGQFLVSTPNRLYYTESRSAAGPNPYHQHEFDYEEFHAELSAVFPHVSMFLENHVEGVAFQPVESSRTVEARVGGRRADPATAHFFLAVCAMRPQTGAPVFVYIPESGNLLRERERHIGLLERELAAKDAWLEKAKNELAALHSSHQALLNDHNALGENFKDLHGALEKANRWAESSLAEAKERGARVVEMQHELDKQTADSTETVRKYETKIQELDEDLVARTEWARKIERDFTAALEQKDRDLANAAEALNAEAAGRTAADALAAELTALVSERTAQAKRLETEAGLLSEELAHVRNSRWVRLGGLFRVGPLS